MTVHNEAKIGEIAKKVIMPGDPMRAKYIAETYLENCKLVNNVRGMLAYTGTYKGTEVTIMASGMGMPSMGIYAYELYKFYEVEQIVRIGTCGAYDEELNLFDVVLSETAYNEGGFALNFDNKEEHYSSSNQSLNDIIENQAKQMNIPLKRGNTTCVECVDFYMTDKEAYFNRIPKELKPIAGEMEAFALFYIANMFKRKAACILTVVDSIHKTDKATPEERESAVNKMIELALNSL